jgi:hypothetical protein
MGRFKVFGGFRKGSLPLAFACQTVSIVLGDFG